MRSVISALFRVQESGFISFFSIRGRRLLALIASVALLIGGLSLQGASAADATNLYVKTSGDDGKDCLSEANACKTIQAAINKAPSGAVINVAGGTYAEALTVSKSLTIRGPNTGISPNTDDPLEANTQRVREATLLTPSGDALHALALSGTGITVEVQGMDVDMSQTRDYAKGKGQRFISSGVRNLTLKVAETIFQNNKSADGGNWLLAGGGTESVEITRNRFTGSSTSNGISAGWNAQSFRISATDNVWLDNRGWTMNLGERNGPGVGTFAGNWIGNTNQQTVEDDTLQFGLLFTDEWSDLKVTGNTFFNINQTAIKFFDDTSAEAFSGIAQVTNNLFTGLTNVAKTSFGSVRLSGGSNTAQAGGIALLNNGFLNSSPDVVGVSNAAGRGTMTATSNWWGSADGPALNKVPSVEGQVRVNTANGGDVLVEPWITNYVDDPAKAGQPGFWPLVGAVQREIPQTDDPVPPITLNNFVTGNTVTLTFGSGIAAGGALTVSAFDGSAGTGEFPVPVSGFQLGDPPVYFTFEKDATFDPKPPFEVCFSVPASNATYGDPVLYRNPNIAGGDEPWERVAEQSYAAGDPGTLCATLTSFSTYAVAAPEPKPDPDPEPSVTASPSPTPTATATPTPTPTPTPGPTVDKKRQRATARAALPKRIKASGVTVIAPRNPRTNAGKRIATTVKCTPRGSQAAGETRFCTVIRGPQGKVSLRTFGNPLRVVVRQTAPATSTYLPFVKRAVYVKGRQR